MAKKRSLARIKDLIDSGKGMSGEEAIRYIETRRKTMNPPLSVSERARKRRARLREETANERFYSHLGRFVRKVP